MSTYVYDFEVFKCNWLCVFYDPERRTFAVADSDCPDALIQYMKQHREDLFVGFNTKGYDQWIMKTILAGGDTEDVKAVNDFLIAGGNGWEHPFFRQGDSFFYRNVDLMDDMQKGLSLKAIEGHLGMDIRESSVPFDLDRPLTLEEYLEVVEYCKHDVLATARLMEARKDYLSTKINVGAMAGIAPEKALSMTNAKLTAAFLGAEAPKEPWTDERQYKYPDNLKREYIPQEVFDFFDRMYDPNIPDEDLFKSKLEITLGKAEATIGFGGIHLGIPNYMWEGSK